MGPPFPPAAIRSLIAAPAATGSRANNRRRRMTPRNITDPPFRKEELPDEGEGGVVDLDLGRRTEVLQQLTFRLCALFRRRAALDLGLHVFELQRPRSSPAEHLEHVVPVRRGHDAAHLL